MTDIVNVLSRTFGRKKELPDQSVQIQQMIQIPIQLIQPELLPYQGTLPLYVWKPNELLSNASSEQIASYRLSEIYSGIVSSKKREVTLEEELYQTLSKKLKNVQDAILQDDAAIAILATIASNNGVPFNTPGKFNDAYSSLVLKLRELFSSRAYTNTQIHAAFIGLLEGKYIAQGKREGLLVLAASSKIDVHLY